MSKPHLPYAALLSAVLCAGCATSKPSAELAAAGVAIAAAQPSPELTRAQTKVALAQRWIDARDYGPARWLAEQAEVDAELAAARQAAESALLAVSQQGLALRKTSLSNR